MNEVLKEVLKKLLAAEELTTTEIAELTAKLESAGCKWRNLGDIEANLARVNIVGSGAHTLAERITNGIDATIEHQVIKQNLIEQVGNPREAVMKVFSTPNGYLVNLDKNLRQQLADKAGIEVFVKPNGIGANVIFKDKGTGLTRQEMPITILSLNESNKFRKRYLMGQYGQGGSTTCAFSEYTIIISRKNNGAESPITFTIIRFNDLKEDMDAKDGKYEYIIMEDDLPPSVESDGVSFPVGTLVAHIEHETGVHQGFINYYNLFDQILFDPPLPYQLYYEKWDTGSKRTLSGLRRRLQQGELTQKWNEYTYKFPDNQDYGELTIRWFLLKPERVISKIIKGKKISKIKPIKSSDVLHDSNFPIFITYNGQVHGMLRKHVLKDECRFGYIYNSLIIQVECDKLSQKGRKFLLRTSRDKATDKGEKLIEEALVTMLSEDEYLQAENEKRESQLINTQVDKSMHEMREKLAEMLKRLDPGKFGFMIAKGGPGTTTGKSKTSGRTTKTQLVPLPTKPEPTFITIVNKTDPIELVFGKTTRLRIESDAPDGLLAKGWSMGLNSSVNDKVKVHSTSDFRGGRAACIIELTDNAVIGDKLEVEVYIQKDEKTITSQKRAMVVIEQKAANKNQQITINAPKIEPVYEGSSFYITEEWTSDNVATVREGSEITVYVNMSNKWLESTLKVSKYAEPKKKRLKNEYLLHVAFHAFLQNESYKGSDINMNDDELEGIRNHELDRVARTLIVAMTSATAFSEDQ